MVGLYLGNPTTILGYILTTYGAVSTHFTGEQGVVLGALSTIESRWTCFAAALTRIILNVILVDIKWGESNEGNKGLLGKSNVKW